MPTVPTVVVAIKPTLAVLSPIHSHVVATGRSAGGVGDRTGAAWCRTGPGGEDKQGGKNMACSLARVQAQAVHLTAQDCLI